MDLFDVVRSCFRRWYVVLPIALLTAWFAHDIYKSARPVYYSNAVIGVAPQSLPVTQTTPGTTPPRNGLLDVGGATLITNMATLGLMDSTTREQVVKAGGKSGYTVRMFPVPGTMPQLPMVMIEATEADPVAAKQTVELVAAQANSTLRTLQKQAGVVDEQMVLPFIVSPPLAPVPGVPSRTKSTVAVAVAGAGLAVLAGTVIDVLLTWWKAGRRGRHRAQIEATDESTASDEATNGQAKEKDSVAGEIVVDNR